MTTRSKLVQTGMERIEEGEEEYPDPVRDRQRMAKQWTCGTWIVLIIILMFVVIGGFVAWGMFKPEAPIYKFVVRILGAFFFLIISRFSVSRPPTGMVLVIRASASGELSGNWKANASVGCRLRVATFRVCVS